MTHPVYPGGPDCNPHCPGEHSMYHDGYADGFEMGERHATGEPPDPLDRLRAIEAAARALDDFLETGLHTWHRERPDGGWDVVMSTDDETRLEQISEVLHIALSPSTRPPSCPGGDECPH